MTQRFRILYDLAAGGMGVVSVAELVGQRGFRRIVAVKRIRPDLARDPRFVDMLASEARITSYVKHPGVVEVLELAEQDGELLLVMALVEGTSLRGLQNALEDAGRVMPVNVAARIVLKAARALHAAHEAVGDTRDPLHLVHRDVSPQNILLSFDGEVKVTDFGIAKVISGDDATRSSTLRGKPAYLSPEQARGHVVDRRTDVWSLGVVAFELFTGQRLFKGRTDLETLKRLLEDPVLRVDEVRRDVPAAVADVIERCLRRDLDERWPDADSIAAALEGALAPDRRASREDVAALVDEAIPGEREACQEDLRLALAADPQPPVQRPPSPRGAWRPFVFAIVGFVLAFSLRMGVSALGSPREPARPGSLSTPTETPVPNGVADEALIVEPEHGEDEPPAEVAAEVEPLGAEPVVTDVVEVEPTAERSARSRRRSRRGGESMRSPPVDESSETTAPSETETTREPHLIAEEFPL